VGGELYEELGRQDAHPLVASTAAHYKPKGTFFGTGTKGGGGDILSMLVSFYGRSKELFQRISINVGRQAVGQFGL
jgi:hypothetical protein